MSLETSLFLRWGAGRLLLPAGLRGRISVAVWLVLGDWPVSMGGYYQKMIRCQMTALQYLDHRTIFCMIDLPLEIDLPRLAIIFNLPLPRLAIVNLPLPLLASVNLLLPLLASIDLLTRVGLSYRSVGK